MQEHELHATLFGVISTTLQVFIEHIGNGRIYQEAKEVFRSARQHYERSSPPTMRVTGILTSNVADGENARHITHEREVTTRMVAVG